MRRPLVAGNWKMFNTVADARVLIKDLIAELTTLNEVDIVVCPPFTSILPAAALLEGTSIGVGAQNMHWEASGAYTGEIAPSMVAEFCKYVIIGHSERRALFGETDIMVNKKVKAAIAAGLIPIVCVGETLEENETGKTKEVVVRQITEGLKGMDSSAAQGIVIAYEPVWAIGTGRAATGEGANAVVAEYIRPALKALFDDEVSQEVRVLYGGSVKASNAAEFFRQPEIDGALVGGASLKAAEFTAVVKAAAA